MITNHSHENGWGPHDLITLKGPLPNTATSKNSGGHIQTTASLLREQGLVDSLTSDW
jgi:hypothetical protein